MLYIWEAVFEGSKKNNEMAVVTEHNDIAEAAKIVQSRLKVLYGSQAIQILSISFSNRAFVD